MIPVLVAIPSKLVFFVALVLGLVTLVRELWKKRGDPGATLSLNPILLLVVAVMIMGLRAGSIVPTRALFFATEWKPLPIHAYGVMLGLAMIVGWFLAMRLAKEDGIPQETAGAIYMWTAVWAIVGARILWGITNPDELKSNPLRLVFVWEGGLVAYGGMIGGFLASWYGCRKNKIPLLRWADVSAPSVVLGTAITRVGCLLFGCDYGARTDKPWGIRFPQNPPWHANPAPAWQHHFNQHLVTQADRYSLPVHPTQIYEMLAGLLIFALVMFLRRVRKFSGEVFVGWVLGYGILRSIIEIFRDDDDRGIYGGISTSQWIGMTSSVLAIVLLVKLYQKYRQDPASLRLWEQPLPVAVPAEAAPAPRARKQRRRAR
jgi:phosphatidylglycerol:prolipoprotein diacylglycerol transferase